MIRVAICVTLGLLFGAIIAALVVPYLGLIGFSGSYLQVVVGYSCSCGIGAVLGFASRRNQRLRFALAGAAMAFLATFVIRSLPLPWLNLVWLDGTSGPAGELPAVILPLLGMFLGGIFGAARDDAAPPSAGSR